MAGTDIILGSLALGVTGIGGLHLIATKAGEARQLKAECLRLGNFAALILTVLRKNEAVLKKLESTGDLHALAQDLVDFLVFCLKQWTVFQKAWEVMWRRKIPSMTKQMWAILHLCMFESNVSGRSEIQALDRGVASIIDHVQEVKQVTSSSLQALEAQQDRITAIENLTKLTHELEQARKEQPSPTAVSVEYDHNDRRISLSGEEEGKRIFGTLKSGAKHEKVVCIQIDAEEMRKGQQGPRHVEIYRRISGAALVQPFFGIKMHGQQPYAVMQDVRGCPTLSSLIADERSDDEPLSRLRVAHEIASTVAYLHEAHIQIKNLADNVISFVERSGRLVPVICELEQARLFLEPTTSIAYDVRYEAPEYGRMEVHSRYTDIWSLGILLWQCVTNGAPFDIAAPVAPSSAIAVQLRSQITAHRKNEGHLPFAKHGIRSLPEPLQELIKSCCNPTEVCRPPAAQVAQELFDIWARSSSDFDKIDFVKTNDLPNAEREAWEALFRKRKDKTLTSKLSTKSIDALKIAASRGKAISVFLLGALTLYGVIDAEEPSEIKDSSVILESKQEEHRARAAIPHLEFAVSAGIPEATKEAGRAYIILGRHYVRAHERLTKSQSQD